MKSGINNNAMSVANEEEMSMACYVNMSMKDRREEEWPRRENLGFRMKM